MNLTGMSWRQVFGIGSCPRRLCNRWARKDRSTAARELLNYGWEFLMLRHYKEGILSLEGLAKKLDLSVSEAIDLLAKLGIEAPIEFEDYLKGFEVFRDK